MKLLTNNYCKFFSYNIYIYTKYIIYIYYTLESSHDIDTDIAISNDKTNYVSELRTTHLVKQDDVGMTVVVGADIDINHGDLLS